MELKRTQQALLLTHTFERAYPSCCQGGQKTGWCWDNLCRLPLRWTSLNAADREESSNQLTGVGLDLTMQNLVHFIWRSICPEGKPDVIEGFHWLVSSLSPSVLKLMKKRLMVAQTVLHFEFVAKTVLICHCFHYCWKCCLHSTQTFSFFQSVTKATRLGWAKSLKELGQSN